MDRVRLYGPNWSAYVRTARLALIEKGVDYDLIEVDFSSGRMPAEHLARHPFGKVPVLAHGDFLLYETSAICRYVDSAFEGPPLQCSNPMQLGRMAQMIAIMDAYLSEEIRMGFVNERLINPMIGENIDEARVISSQAAIEKGFLALCGCTDEAGYLIGSNVTLADLHAVPLFDYLSLTPGGRELIDIQPRLANWWEYIESRSSIAQTTPDLTVFKNMGKLAD